MSAVGVPNLAAIDRPQAEWPSATGELAQVRELRESATEWHFPPRYRTAFSLIELLVVISVIVLLIAMLLPSLRSAREQARSAVCSSNTMHIGRAAAVYSTEWSGWLCGSPGTSGSVMFTDGPRPEAESEEFDHGPSQIWDYAGPLAAESMNMSLPANRAERMRSASEGVFHCPSNPFFADPYPKARGSFKRQPMVSYNTFRNFLMWSRTMVDGDPSKPWGVKAPHPEASFDRIGGRTLTPKNHVPRIDLIANPAGKAYLADGNRFTDETGVPTYDLEWDALDGGAFCNGGPTLREYDAVQFVLSSYHFSKQLGRYGYRHRSGGERGIVVNHFDGHSEFVGEKESRQPDRWWPTGTIIPFADLNDRSREQLVGRFDREFNYIVGR